MPLVASEMNKEEAEKQEWEELVLWSVNKGCSLPNTPEMKHTYLSGMNWEKRNPRTFVLRNTTYSYFSHPLNLTWKNERVVEIPIVAKAVTTVGSDKRILEVGNVLRQYGFDAGQDVVDIQGGEKVYAEDILEYRDEAKYDLIVSISTFEHVGVEDGTGDPSRAILAVKHLMSLLRPQGRLLATVPVGYNHTLDGWLFSWTRGTCRFLLRVSRDNRWTEVDKEVVQWQRYGSPWSYANAVTVIDVVQ